ncbi:MAG: CsgG/HfaB family protein [Candidatus Sericytochromatia bacterium]
MKKSRAILLVSLSFWLPLQAHASTPRHFDAQIRRAHNQLSKLRLKPQAIKPSVSRIGNARVMMLPFANHLKDPSPAIQHAALDTFQQAFLKPGQSLFKVVDRRHLQGAIKELAFSESALGDPQTVLKLGKLLSANLMLSGSVSKGKIHTSEVTHLKPTQYTWATVQVNVVLTHVESGEIVFSSSANGISARYPSWQGDTFTSLILDAIHNASEKLVLEMRDSQESIQQVLKP